ncbi:MAG: hypothetical protein JWO07_378 [Candidatus Saccharibacteria bacterium]|nr:hypothetical protein [Candidatus Saccharibacteria bacterium]
MYSGTTFRTKSGRIMGVHQRIDRLARRELHPLLAKRQFFPSEREILHFEGLNGPDGVKRKSPGQDEPWHYLDPTDPTDNRLRDMIQDHMHNLTVAIVDGDKQRSSFEAAWLAHSIVDGLTPAHHYPLEEKLEELRDGEGLETRNSTRKKLVMPGKTRRHQLRNNWEFWGAKGVMTTHFTFELGIATTIATGRLLDCTPSGNDIVRVKTEGYMPLFDESLNRIVQLGMYEEFYRAGWTRRMARETKTILIPEIIRTVTLAWYKCALDAEAKKAKK